MAPTSPDAAASTPPAPAARSRSRNAAAALGLLALAIVCSVASAWAVLAGSVLDGPFAVTAGVALVAAQLLGRPEPSREIRFLSGLADRLIDGAILSALAWVAWPAAPRVAALALVALCLSFFATYVRARGATLAYPVEESPVNRGVRYALIALSVSVGAGWAEGALWALAGFMALTWLVRITQVVKGERAA